MDLNERNLAAKYCKDRVEANKIADVRSVIVDCKFENVKHEDYAIVAHTVAEDKRYSIKERPDGFYDVIKNPNYELTQSVIETNNIQRKILWIMAGFALLTLVVQAIDMCSTLEANKALSPRQQNLRQAESKSDSITSDSSKTQTLIMMDSNNSQTKKAKGN